MNFFLDTNVMLGFIFETDNWNSKSSEVFKHSAPKYSSCYAQKECQHRYKSQLNRALRELRLFFKKIHLAKSYQELNSQIQNNFPITRDILIDFLKVNNSLELSELANEFSKFKLKTEIKCKENYKKISGIISFHTSQYPHRELANILQKCGLLQEDCDDIEIIIDAHDLGLTVGNLVFITGDYRHIVSRKNDIIQNSSIDDIIGLGEFNYT